MYSRKGKEMRGIIGARRSKWRRPRLTIVARDRPEERVLGVCKGNGSVGPGSTWCIMPGACSVWTGT